MRTAGSPVGRLEQSPRFTVGAYFGSCYKPTRHVEHSQTSKPASLVVTRALDIERNEPKGLMHWPDLAAHLTFAAIAWPCSLRVVSVLDLSETRVGRAGVSKMQHYLAKTRRSTPFDLNMVTGLPFVCHTHFTRTRV